MKQQKGFTLIELIIVIVILGILAVTAAPKFFDFSSSARASTVEGAKAAIQGAMQIEYAKAAIDGSAAYPAATAIAAAAGLSSSDWDFAIDTGVIKISPVGANSVATKGSPTFAEITDCYVEYDPTSANANTPPTITTDTTGC